MAIFLQNTSNVFAGASIIKPDFDRIERMLKLRQSMYDEGAKKVKSLYESVFNSAMLRDGNINRRDQYLKTITESLNNLSAMDLSLQQNQQFASTLFSPVLNDRALVHDMSWTKSYQNEMSRLESYRTSSDPKIRKQYWDVGKRALQYQAEEYKNTDDESAMSMSTPKYVPQIDFQTLAEKAFKESGISVKEDVINGGYIWTKKNGESVFPVTQSYVESLFSTDPGIREMFRTQAWVNRKDFIKQNADKYGSEEKAESAYLSQILTDAGYGIQQKYDKANLDLKELEIKKQSWDKIIKDRGIVPGSAEHDQYMEDMEKYRIAQQTVNNIDNTLLPSQTLDFNNINDVRNQVDNLVMLSNYTQAINKTAKFLAMKDAELTVKVDPISLAEYRANLSLRNSQIMARVNYLNKLRFLEAEVDAGKYSGGGGSGRGGNNALVADRQKRIDALNKKKSDGTITEKENDELIKLEKKQKEEKKSVNSSENIIDVFETPQTNSSLQWKPFKFGTYDPYSSSQSTGKKLPIPKSTRSYIVNDEDKTNETNETSTATDDDVKKAEDFWNVPEY